MPTAQSTSKNQAESKPAKQPQQQPSGNKPQKQQQQQKQASKMTPPPAELQSNVSEVVQQSEQLITSTGQSGGSGGNRTPQEQPEFIKQAMIIIEKKVRNLEKRRIKLEEYKDSQSKGTPLNQDQQSAVDKYEEVLRSLELARELEKQFVALANDAMKQQKKQAKKDQLEREEQVKEKLRETHKLLSVLDTFGDDLVRNDFLNETNGAFKLTEQEIKLLDDFNQLVKTSSLGPKLDLTSGEAADHLVALIDGKNKQINALSQSSGSPVTYQELRRLFDRILSSSYWNQETQLEKQPEQEQQQTLVSNEQEKSEHQQHLTTESTHEHHDNLNNTVGSSNLESKPVTYLQQNTSDDFVIVSQNDLNENNVNTLSKSPSRQDQDQLSNAQHQQAQTKTFFTTLNPAEVPPHRNINEFLNRVQNDDEGINFLQDSEILQRQQQHQEQQQNDFQNQQSNQQQNNFNFQESNQNDVQKDNQFRQRGGNQNGGNQQRSGGYQQKPRYPDDRRSGGPPRNNGNDRNGAPRNQGANGGPAQYNRNSNGYRGGQNPGNRGGQSSNPSGNGGYYRNQNQGGPRNPQNNGPRGNYQPRSNQDLNQHQQEQMA